MSAALRVLLVDDEPLALERLRGLFPAIREAEVVGTALGCQSAVEAIRRLRPDLVLLDIRMRDGSAFDILKALDPSDAPAVIFSTAYAKYACQAFEVHALDYLLKPVDPERLRGAIYRAIRNRTLRSAAERASELERVVTQLREDERDPPQRYDQEIWIRTRGTEHVRVPTATIVRIAALDDYVSIHTETGQEHLLRSTLDSVAAVLDPDKFARIHRSSIVRRDLVAKIVSHRTGGRSAVLVDGTSLAIGRTYARGMQMTLNRPVNSSGAVGNHRS